MANLVSLQVDTRQVRQAFERLGQQAPTAIMRALNRAGQSVMTEAVRAIAADLALVQREVRKGIRQDRATTANLRTDVVATGRRIPLILFRARGPEPSRGKGKGVSYRLPTGKTRLPHAFIATMRSGHRGVFARVSGSQMVSAPARKRGGGQVKREKIVELFGPSIPRVMARTRILTALRAKGEEVLRKNMQQQIEYLATRRST